ncbi:MAG: hypothetical protein LBV40_06455 [Methanomicrobiales archaeon]|jgi:ABC-type multidrug transport system fused ATPase/permease subunit|nr:hypothetical protein [Methanomicrobiales archaeon]
MMTKEREPTSSFFDMLRYFLRGFKVHALFLLILTITIGLVETFNLALLYPMFSEGFGVSTNSIPFYSVFERLGTSLPMVSPFVNYGIIFILMTFFSLYVLTYGKVIESGTHDDLMKRDDAYVAMYTLSQKKSNPASGGKI